MNILLSLCVVMGGIHALDNGLARTPPMGFLSWERFRCNLNCDTDPKNCISEYLYKSIADVMVSDGYKDAGYEYVNIDDCWLAKNRDANDMLVPDPKRFPSGMLSLSRYMHSKGLKFGIYEDFGKETCAGYPGSEFYLKTDANTFAEWEVDLLKFDGCNSDPKDMDQGYPIMGKYLNLTGRPILYSCEWPLYQLKMQPNYTAIRETCNIWRNYNDIQDSWDSLLSVIKFYGDDKGNFSSAAGPGGFNDPDELMIGDFGLSLDQQRVQFGMWAMWSSPLFISADLRNISADSKAILLNKRVIAINQDPLGAQATLLYGMGALQVWTKPLAASGTYAFALINADDQGKPLDVDLSPNNLGLPSTKGYNITETFNGINLGSFKTDEKFHVQVNPTGIFLATAVPLS